MGATAGVPRLGPGRRAAVYVLEARAQFLTLARTPAFAIPTLAFPLMFYVFFAVVMGFSPTARTYLLATYGVFGLMGPALFGFGVGGFANERESGAPPAETDHPDARGGLPAWAGGDRPGIRHGDRGPACSSSAPMPPT